MCLCNKPPQVPKLCFQPRDTTAGLGDTAGSCTKYKGPSIWPASTSSNMLQSAGCICHLPLWLHLGPAHVQPQSCGLCSSISTVIAFSTCMMLMTILLPLEKTPYKDLYHQFEVNIHFKSSCLTLHIAQHPVTIALSLAAAFWHLCLCLYQGAENLFPLTHQICWKQSPIQVKGYLCKCLCCTGLVLSQLYSLVIQWTVFFDLQTSGLQCQLL